jgi:hypothetical protein
MAKIEKGIIVLFWLILAFTLIPTILPMIVGDAAWILIIVLFVFVIVFPILVIKHKED